MHYGLPSEYVGSPPPPAMQHYDQYEYDQYGAPLQHTPSPVPYNVGRPQTEYLNTQPSYHGSPPPPNLSAPSLHNYATPSTISSRPGFVLHDSGSVPIHEEEDDRHAADDGDVPLLRRDAELGINMNHLNNSSSYPDPFGGSHPDMPIPGAYNAEEEEINNIRYGKIPQRVPRRYKTIKRVELFHGNFVMDQKVPTKLLDLCANKNEREFTHLRYSAATCDPNDFKGWCF